MVSNLRDERFPEFCSESETVVFKPVFFATSGSMNDLMLRVFLMILSNMIGLGSLGFLIIRSDVVDLRLDSREPLMRTAA